MSATEVAAGDAGGRVLERVVELAAEPAAAAFLEVGTFVAVMLALFGLLQWRTGGAVSDWLARHRRLGPLAGALLGAVPGCGGAIVVMPLFLRGTVSFGTVVATLVATMGDSSFVLFAAAPSTALALHGGLLLAGLVTGAIVDGLGYDPRLPPDADARRGMADAVAGTPVVPGAPSTVGAQAAVIGLTGRPVIGAVPPSLVAFWLLLATGFALAVPTVFRLVPAEALDLGPLPTHVLLGSLGTLACVSVVLLRRRRCRTSDRGDTTAERPRDVLLDAGRETAVVTTWVAVAFVGYEVLVASTGLDLGRLPTLGLLGVLAGALLGLVPGCAPQLVLTGLYAQGALPLSVLVANALSQDGDALFPLLASDRRSAVVGTSISTLPGLVVGGILVALGR
jgi:uncharacterized membrane protein